MKWMAVVLSALAITAIYKNASGKTPRILNLSDSEIGTVRTSVGYTTMLQFDSRPTSVVLGDQDAYRVEYVGNGLAIKPILPHAKTNLFVFTDYDRFNFSLVSGPSNQSDFVVKVKREGSLGYAPPSPKEVGSVDAEINTRLVRKNIGKRSTCGGIVLAVETIAWPESRSTYLVQFSASVDPKSFKEKEVRFEPGDFSILQKNADLPIESLHLNRLSFDARNRKVQGTMVLRQSSLRKLVPLRLKFSPDFHRSRYPNCPVVSFSRSGSGSSSRSSI